MENNTNVNINKDENKEKNKLGPITSPLLQKKLVSKVNALTSSSPHVMSQNPHNIVFNTEKGSTLNYKFVVDELVKINNIDNIADFYNRIYSIITNNIDSSFFAIGLFKEK